MSLISIKEKEKVITDNSMLPNKFSNFFNNAVISTLTSICSQSILSLPSENIRKPYGFRFSDVFRGQRKGVGNEWVNIHFNIHPNDFYLTETTDLCGTVEIAVTMFQNHPSIQTICFY